MKFFISLILFFFFISNISSQQRVTNIHEGGTNSKDFVVEYESHNYLLQILPNDSVAVFEVMGVDSVEFLHSQKIGQLSFYNFKNIYDNYLLFIKAKQPFAYDFVNDKIYEIEIPEGYEFDIFFSIKGNYARVSLKNKSKNINQAMIYDLRDKSHKIFKDNNSVSPLGSDLVWVEEFDTILNRHSYFLYNFINNRTDTLIVGANRQFSAGKYLDDSDKLWFTEPDGNLTAFYINLNHFERYPILNISYRSRFKVYHKDHYIYVVNLIDENIYVFKYNKTNYQLDKSFIKKVSPNMEGLGANFAGDKIILTNFSHFFIINVETEQLREINFGGKYNIINDRYLLSLNQGWQLLDLDNLEINVIRGEDYYFNSVDFSSVFLNNNTILIASDYNLENGKKLFYLDTDKKEINYAANLEFNKFGIAREAFLYNLNDKTILISSSNIYEIYEDGYEKINKTPFIEVADYLAMRYRILNNEIYYFDKDSMGRAGIVMKYNGIDNVEICNLNDYVPYFYIENLTDIVQMGNFLYVCYAYNNLLYKIDLSEKKIELIESSVIDIDDDRHNFFVDGNDIYYGTHYRFYKIENNAEPFMYDINSTDGLSKYVFKLRGKLYCLTEKKLFEIKGENLDSIFSYTRNYSSHNFIYDDDYYLNQDRKNIIFPANDSILYNFDGTSIDSLSYSEINDLRKLNYDFLLLNWNSDDIYDMRENELYNIDEFDKNEDVIGIAISKVDTAIITRSWDFTKIYKTKNKFKTVQLDTSIGYDLNVKRVSYFESGNFGILYSGKYVYFVDDKLNVSKMKDIIVPDRPQNIIQKDSFIYFFGIDPEIGHQVYKVKMKTGAVFTEDIYNSKLIIEPNPSHNYILIKDENAINAKFYIYDINGRVIQKGKNTGRINISNLSNGMYIISLQTNQNIYSGLFIKQ